MWIDLFCGTKANYLKRQKRWAAMKLATGAVGFGEHHDRPAARAVILDLMLEGAVSKLFIEMAEMYLSDIGIAGFGAFTIGEYLRQLSQLHTENLGTDPYWEDIARVFRHFDGASSNPVTFEGLIKAAVESGVDVFFYDTALVTSRTSKLGMRKRNVAMGQVFHANSAPNDAGSVVLVGGLHLYPGTSGGLFQHTLQQQCGLGFSHVVDLSRQSLVG